MFPKQAQQAARYHGCRHGVCGLQQDLQAYRDALMDLLHIDVALLCVQGRCTLIS